MICQFRSFPNVHLQLMHNQKVLNFVLNHFKLTLLIFPPWAMFTKPWDVNVENTSSFKTVVSTAQQVLKVKEFTSHGIG